MENALTILGSSSALPTSQRFSTAQVLQILERFFLIDCGEGTQMQLRKVNISFAKIQAIFISHLHGDHYLGIFGVLSSFNLLGRKSKLTIYAPKGFEQIVRFQLQYLVSDLTFPLVFVELPNEPFSCILSDKKIEVFAIKLKHRIPTWGFYFIQKPIELKIRKDVISKLNLTIPQIVAIKRGEDLYECENKRISNSELTYPPEPLLSYAYISDTLYYPDIAKYIKGVSILYHEATFLHDMLPRAIETHHSTSKQAAEFANLCCASKLLIGHFSARYKSVKRLEDEARAIFPNTIAVSDLQVISF